MTPSRRPQRIVALANVAASVDCVGVVTLLLLADPWPAFAYIDPGTGSALIGIVSAVVVSAYFALRAAYYRLVEFLFRVRHKSQRCNLAIHCEDPRYEITFFPVMRALSAQGVEATFFTMYGRDASFEPLPALMTHSVIMPGLAGYAHLNHLEAKLLITTTPQLDVMTFRRSKRVQHYCHIPHALGECRYVRPYAYDFFDSVLCCGDVLKTNIRRMEAIRRLPAKLLLETGIPHYDELLVTAAASERVAHAPPVVLVAPSWGPFSIFENFGTDIVGQLANRYRVVVRPHPQMRHSQGDLYADVLALAGHPGIEVDLSRTPASVMARADLLISDISGIMHEFAFIYEKPVIFVDHRPSVAGLEGELLGGDSELKDHCREFITPIAPSNFENLETHVTEALQRQAETRIRQVRDEVIYNFGRSGHVAARQIKELLECH